MSRTYGSLLTRGWCPPEVSRLRAGDTLPSGHAMIGMDDVLATQMTTPATWSAAAVARADRQGGEGEDERGETERGSVRS